MKRHLERYHNNQNPTIDGVSIDINNIRNKISGRKREEESREEESREDESREDESRENMDHGHGLDHGTDKGHSFCYQLNPVATDELLCLKNAGTQISMFFNSNE